MMRGRNERQQALARGPWYLGERVVADIKTDKLWRPARDEEHVLRHRQDVEASIQGLQPRRRSLHVQTR